MVSSNVLQRVFCIRVGSNQATAFTIEECKERGHAKNAKNGVRSWCAKRSLAFLAGCKSRSGEGSEAIPRKG